MATPSSPRTRRGLSFPQTLARLLVAILTAAAGGAAANSNDSLFHNGDLESGSDGKPADWGLVDGATWEKEGGNHFLRLLSPGPGAMVMVYRAVELGADTKALRLQYKVRYENIIPGKESWFDGRIMLNFKGQDKKVVTPGPNHPNFKGTSAKWREAEQEFRVPKGAVTLELMFTLFNAQGGQLDFDDIRLTPIPVQAIDEAEAAAKVKDDARIAAMPRPKAQVAAPVAEKLPSALHVVGNQLQNVSGSNVWLQGVAIPSLEWSGAGDHVLESIGVAIKDWKANCIRLPVRENFWAGRGPYQNDGGMQYRQIIDDAINACAGNGIYLVLDLHDFRAANEQHLAFWKEVSHKYANHPAVLFELLNEPHDIPWEVWRSGGVVTDKKKPGDATAAENEQKLQSFTAVGMQQLLDAVRQQGAKNVVVIGGLDWGYDLSGVLDGHALEEHGGNGIVYSSHVYPWKSDWEGKFLKASEKYPLFLGEVGADIKKMSFIPPERQEDPYTWAPDMIGVIQKHKLNWTAWCFHPESTPRRHSRLELQADALLGRVRQESAGG